MSDQDLFERFKRRAVEVLSVDDAQVKMDAKFADDLDADSLALVEIIMAVEDRLDIQVPEEELKDIQTVGAALDLLASKVGSAA